MRTMGNGLCDEVDCAAKNEPFVCKDEERKPGEKTKDSKESNKNEEVEPFWMTFALGAVTTHIGQ